jgi:hypothetical protein
MGKSGLGKMLEDPKFDYLLVRNIYLGVDLSLYINNAA